MVKSFSEAHVEEALAACRHLVMQVRAMRQGYRIRDNS